MIVNILPTPQRNYSQGDNLLLYDTFICDGSCVFNENSVCSAVYNLTANVLKVINRATTSVEPKVKHFVTGFPILEFVTSRRKICVLRNLRIPDLIIIAVF
jgi:hypothetical protein